MNANHQNTASPSGRKTSKLFALRRASAHSPLSSAMMVILPMVVIATFGYFLYAAGVFEDFTQSETGAKPPPKSISTTRVSLLKPSLTRFDKKSRTYLVRAQSAAREIKQPDIVHLNKVNTEIRMAKSTTKVHVTSDKGVYNRKTEVMMLITNVVMNTTNGYRATLARATLWLNQGRLASKTPVILYMPRGTVAANGLEVLESGRRIRFLNRARMIIEPAEKTKKP